MRKREQLLVRGRPLSHLCGEANDLQGESEVVIDGFKAELSFFKF